MPPIPRIRHEHLILAAAALLAGWLVEASLVLGLTAALLGLAALAVARGRGAFARALAGLTVLTGLAAVQSTLAVRRVELAWPDVRQGLLEKGQQQLDRTLGDAVMAARRVAGEALEVASREPMARLEALEALVPVRGLEEGVTIFDERGQPAAWAGRHRVPATVSDRELDVAITPFYAVVNARRQRGGWTAVGQVLLAADSAVPDRERSVGEQFAQRTSTGLEIFAAQAPPPSAVDVFDYCLPECRPAEGRADTLFSVRIVPPTQGFQKLRLVSSGGRRVAWLTVGLLLALALLPVGIGRVTRFLALAGLAGMFVLTPAGERIGLGDFFSPATYYSPFLGPFSGSAGALGLTATLLGIVAAGVTGALRGRVAASGAGLLIGALTPFAVRYLARGITLPAEGANLGLWLTWQSAIAAAAIGLLIAGGAIGWRAEDRPRGWLPLVAAGSALVLAGVGLVNWQPAGWSTVYVLLWVPVAAAAVPTRRSALALGVAGIVGGTLAATTTWDAGLRGRLQLADRDAARLGSEADPVGAGLLETFGRSLARGPAPQSAAALYRVWERSALARDDYPAMLAVWDSTGRITARLALAPLDLPPSLVQRIAQDAPGAAAPVAEGLLRAQGVHYVLAVPFPDGEVVTVGIGPVSRAFEPVRVGRFLRGESGAEPPYDVALAEPFARSPEAIGTWRREGWLVRGERVLELQRGAEGRRVSLIVGMGDLPQYAVRGVLVVALDVGLVALIWLVGTALAGRLPSVGAIGRALRLRSYRTRLALVLGVFFVAPTVLFAAWSVARLEAEAQRSGRLLASQTLRDAGGAARELAALDAGAAAEGLTDLAARFGADLMLYDGGRLTVSSMPILQELGLLDPLLPSGTVRHLLIEDDLEASDDVVIGGRRTRVAFRAIGMNEGRPLVLASPRLVDDLELNREQQDLAFAVLLATLLGVLAAVTLAARASGALARPVHVLRSAAEAFGRGEALPALDRDVPLEFVPVAQGLARMADDVRASQAALEAARRRTATVLRSVATGVVALDRDMQVTIANPRAADLLGSPLVSGTGVREATGADWGALWDWVVAFIAGTDPHDVFEMVVGGRRIRSQIAALGTDGGCVVALDDTTDLAHAVRVLAWGELARQIAHEIKNPLTPIRLGIQHLERAYRDGRGDFGQALARTAEQILAEIERLDAIARAFSRFGAPPAEAGPLAREDLGAAAQETAHLYALGSGPAVTVQSPEMVTALVRRDEFKEVLVNLVENARNAGATRVSIEVRRGTGERGVEVAVRDDGSGIPAEHLSRIFEPQFSTTTSGTGLGLAICRRLVESWGGSIEVASEPGSGTVVTLGLKV